LDSLALLIDFGSTYTKVVAVNLHTAQVIGRSQAASTVSTDVQQGLLHTLRDLHARHSVFEGEPDDLKVLEGKLVLASSSAAGGLRMAVIGLVPGLTVEAANLAALGAGAKVVGSWSFKLSQAAVQEIESRHPDIILLTGGTDGGDSATIVHNACLLAVSRISVPILMAGNQSIAARIREILTDAGKEVICVPNVMPRPGELQVESAREEIRNLFMERITRVKGFGAIRKWVPALLPTPMAVLEGVLLGAVGTDTERGSGDMLVVDVGGATTDVHSIGYGRPTGPSVIERGLPEPFAKRTVEGDLGIRFNAVTLIDRVGVDRFERAFRAAFPEFAIPREELVAYVEHVSQQTAQLPQTNWQTAVDAQLARVAVDLAVERHVGKKERIITREGETWMQFGKDLTETKTLIGTGGIFIHNSYASHILAAGQNENSRAQILRPKNPRLLVDASYLLYAIGLLAKGHPAVALRLFQAHIKPLAFPNPRKF
jgi:uncharacterized protein (TIGR01319 family)